MATAGKVRGEPDPDDFQGDFHADWREELDSIEQSWICFPA